MLYWHLVWFVAIFPVRVIVFLFWFLWTIVHKQRLDFFSDCTKFSECVLSVVKRIWLLRSGVDFTPGKAGMSTSVLTRCVRFSWSPTRVWPVRRYPIVSNPAQSNVPFRHINKWINRMIQLIMNCNCFIFQILNIWTWTNIASLVVVVDFRKHH